jgi:hypothetical protein
MASPLEGVFLGNGSGVGGGERSRICPPGVRVGWGEGRDLSRVLYLRSRKAVGSPGPRASPAGPSALRASSHFREISARRGRMPPSHPEAPSLGGGVGVPG